MRIARGSFRLPGPAAVWYRAERPIVDGAAISPLMRAAIAADFCNGTSSVLDFREWTFINGDLTLSLAREPVGDWILLDAETWAGPEFDRHRRRAARRPRGLLRPRRPERALREALRRRHADRARRSPVRSGADR